MESIRLLLTDDNDEIRAALREQLSQQEDMQIVGEARNGTEALQMIADHTIDVMLLDIIMPQLDGYGVLEQLPRCWLVAASGMAGMGTPNTIQTRKITKRFYLCGDGESDVAEPIGLVAPRVMLCAAHQAHTVLRILAGEYEV